MKRLPLPIINAITRANTPWPFAKTLALAVATFASTANFAQAQYIAYDLGTLGGLHSYAYGINNSGTIVGFALLSGGYAEQAFSYSAGVMTDLGTLAGYTSSVAYGINSNGTIVGYSYNSGGPQHAFSYSGGLMTDLGTLGGGSSVAYGINNSGTIVGYAYTSGGPQHAFSYSGGLMTDLGTLGGLNSQANAINSSGTIVGYAETSVGSHAFSYRGGVMIDLEPYLASIGMTGDSVATAINDNGDIVGYASLSNGINHAFLLQAMAPSITSQPQAQQTAVLGSTVAFVVITGGAQPLTYQWEFNGTNIAGATASSLTLTNVQAAQAGNYLVVVSNAWGCVSSWNAVLTVVPATTPGGATGTAVVLDGFVVAATIIDGGYGYTNTPTVKIISGGGSGADAVAVVSNGLVIAVNVMDAGYGYTNTPLVVIAPPSIPNPVLSIAPMSFLSFSNLTVGGLYQLQQSMAWYWSNQPVSFTATNSSYTQIVAGLAGSGDYRLALNPVPAQAFATAVVDYGFVVHATVTSGGSGYVTSPTITIVGGGGTNATAVSHISGGVVTGITIADAGIGYTNTPTVRIAPPPAAAVFSTVQPVIRVGSANLAPYNNYQIQFKPDLGGTWGNWNGGLFSPSGVTNSQYLFITNGVGFFRLKYVP